MEGTIETATNHKGPMLELEGDDDNMALNF